MDYLRVGRVDKAKLELSIELQGIDTDDLIVFLDGVDYPLVNVYGLVSWLEKTYGATVERIDTYSELKRIQNERCK